MASIHLEELSAGTPQATLAQARALLLEYGGFAAAQPDAARFCLGALELEATGLPWSYIEQGGGSLLAWAPGQSCARSEPAGFIAWRALTPNSTVPPGAWEMKRLWVRPACRGLGLGRVLAQAVLDRARSAGRTAVFLDTVPAVMEAAHRMYLQLGFLPCASYNDNPIENIAYLVKFLEGPKP